jgi:hypothetical protein
MENNIHRVYRMADRHTLKEGMGWYQTTNTFAHGLADKHGITVRQAAGVIAALSPRLYWDRNMHYADQFCATGYAPVLNLSRRKAGMILFDNIDPDVAFAPASRNSGQKVRSFFNCIIDPNCDDVCIDRHAYDIAVGEKGNDVSRGTLRLKGVYDNIRDTYRSLANKIGIIPNQLQAVTWCTWKQL